MTSPDNLVVFAHRPPTEAELARLRLLLSTFQDGTGMQAIKDSLSTLPGWRDFERAVALAFGGIPSEDKSIMDVHLPDLSRKGVSFGISCKMRSELNRVRRDGRVTIELSNAAGAFWDKLGNDQITPQNHSAYAPQIGRALINQVREWHSSVSTVSGGNVDLAGSCHLALMWNRRGEYQLFQFGIDLPDPERILWYYPLVRRKGVLQPGKAVCGNDFSGRLFEWYGQSGGQLKYYPKASDALWQSEVFRLEPLPPNTRHGLISKAETYYPGLWPM